MTKVITVAALKGGVGKTMFTVNLAGCLAESSGVLIVDADPQSNATNGVGIDIFDVEGASIDDVFAQPSVDPANVIAKSPIEELPSLDIIPGSLLLFKAELALFQRPRRETVLDRWLRKHAEYLSRYDYIIIDTAPGMGLVNQNAFAASDSIVLVTDVSLNGYRGSEIFIDLWDVLREDMELKDNVGALCVNLYDKRIGLSKDFVLEARESDVLAPLLVEPPIPSRVKFKDTEIDARPININARGTEEHLTMRAIIDELMRKEVL